MANLNLPNVREGGDIRFRIGLEDNGVAVDWSGLEGIRVFLYADAQLNFDFGVKEPLTDEQLLAALEGIDDVIYVGGISPQLEGEEMRVDFEGFKGGDRTSIELPAV